MSSGRAAARPAGIKDSCIRLWGKYVEQSKKRDPGSANERGDYTWEELLDVAEEFLEDNPKCSKFGNNYEGGGVINIPPCQECGDDDK